MLGDDPDHLPPLQGGVRDNSHKPHIRPAVNETDFLPREQHTHGPGCLPIGRIRAKARSAENTDTPDDRVRGKARFHLSELGLNQRVEVRDAQQVRHSKDVQKDIGKCPGPSLGWLFDWARPVLIALRDLAGLDRDRQSNTRRGVEGFPTPFTYESGGLAL